MYPTALVGSFFCGCLLVIPQLRCLNIKNEWRSIGLYCRLTSYLYRTLFPFKSLGMKAKVFMESAKSIFVLIPVMAGLLTACGGSGSSSSQNQFEGHQTSFSHPQCETNEGTLTFANRYLRLNRIQSCFHRDSVRDQVFDKDINRCPSVHSGSGDRPSNCADTQVTIPDETDIAASARYIVAALQNTAVDIQLTDLSQNRLLEEAAKRLGISITKASDHQRFRTESQIRYRLDEKTEALSESTLTHIHINPLPSTHYRNIEIVWRYQGATIAFDLNTVIPVEIRPLPNA